MYLGSNIFDQIMWCNESKVIMKNYFKSYKQDEIDFLNQKSTNEMKLNFTKNNQTPI